MGKKLETTSSSELRLVIRKVLNVAAALPPGALTERDLAVLRVVTKDES